MRRRSDRGAKSRSEPEPMQLGRTLLDLVTVAAPAVSLVEALDKENSQANRQTEMPQRPR